MKYVITILAMGAALSFAQTAQPESAASIQFEKTEHDFGKIDKGSKVSTVFKFSNTGASTLEIKDVSTSCGCTSAKPTKTVYEPGEAGEIPVTFNPSRFAGPITKRVTIVSNDAKNPRAVVTIKANIIVDVTVKPSSIFVSKLKRGSTTVEEVMVTTERMERLEVSELTADQPFILPKIERIDDKNVKIMVTIDGNKVPSGETRLRGSISYKTNSKTQDIIKNHVNVLVENPISVRPSSVYMFGTKEGQTREIVVKIQSGEGKAVELSDINVDMNHTIPGAKPDDQTKVDIVTTELVKETDESYSLKINLTGKAAKGRFQGNITVKTNLDEQPEVRIPVRGSVIAPATP